jgi:PAS domain S-box-containing protein
MKKPDCLNINFVLLVLGTLIIFGCANYLPACFHKYPTFSIWFFRIAGISLLVCILVSINRLKAQRKEWAKFIKRHQRLELTLDTGEIGFWDWNIATNEVYFSPNYFIMLGYQSHEFPMKLKTWVDLLHPEDKETIVPMVEKFVQQAKPYEVEFRMQCKDLSWKWISGRGKSYNVDSDGQPQRAFGVHVDIHKRKIAEQQFRNLAAVIEQAIEGISVADLDGYIQYANPTWVKMHGYDSADEIQNKHISIFHTQEQLKTEVIPFNKKVKQNGMHKGEVGHVKKDGNTFPTFMETALLHDSHGKPYAIAGFTQDITEQKQNEMRKKQVDKALVRALKDSEQANNAKNEFLANMSHELRTPMNGIMGMNSLLLKTSLTDEQREFSEIIKKSGNQLLRMINEILNYSHTSSGKKILHSANFNLIKLVLDIIDMMTPAAQEKKLTIKCHISSDTPSKIIGDADVLKKILIHLIENAIKFTLQGDIVVNVNLAAEDDAYAEIKFSVEDEGIGIPYDKQDAIFSTFYQIDSSSTKHFSGTGLGLAIAKQLTTLMNGHIGVNSTPGVGSTFWFTVCLKKSDG